MFHVMCSDVNVRCWGCLSRRYTDVGCHMFRCRMTDVGCRRSDDIRQQMYDRKLDVQCSDVGCQMSGYRIILQLSDLL